MSTQERITLGGGCFWCTEAVFLEVDGVLDVESGYCNGQVAHPTYEQVCGGNSGHVEVVQLSFDPDRISLREVLAIFFAVHDPTQLNRQGNDIGTQYRSGIYLHHPDQQAVAEEVLDEANQALGGRVVTEIALRHTYSRAEDYHQRYFAQHPSQGYCAFVVAPKVDKFRRVFAARLRKP